MQGDVKIVLVGAGSHVFAPSMIHDAILDNRLDGLELGLADVDLEAAEGMASVARRMARDTGVRVDVTVSTEYADLLPGADFVIVCAEVQGRRRWQMDFDLMAVHGLQDQARECGGLGGMLKAFRTVSLVLEIARFMERLCPSAWLFDVTNPMPRVITAVNRATEIRCAGFCNAAHGGYNDYLGVAAWLGMDPTDLDVTTAGLNHFSWILSVCDVRDGTDLLPVLERTIRERTTGLPDAVGEGLAVLLERYGSVAAAGVGHTVEFLPADSAFLLHIHPPYHGTPEERAAKRDLIRRIGAGKEPFEPLFEHRSWERPADVAAALHRGEARRFDMINIPNRGFLPQLPEGRIVEVPSCTLESGELTGQGSYGLPEPLAAICRQVSDVHELVASAAIEGNRDTAREAVEIDPAITDKSGALSILDDLIDQHLDLYPQFRR